MKESTNEFKINEQIILRFENRMPQIYLDGKKIEDLTHDKKEVIFCKNNPDVRNLLVLLLRDREPTFKKGNSLLKYLIRLGDASAKDVVKDLIKEAFKLNDIISLEFYYKALFFYYLTDKEKESFFYSNNEKLRDLINEALKHEGFSLKFGFPLLLLLFRIGDSEAKRVLKKGLLKWIFSEKSTNIDKIIKKYIRPYQQFRVFRYNEHQIVQRFKIFHYDELIEIYENPKSPRQLKEYLDDYVEKFNKIYSGMEELIVSKKILTKKFNVQLKEESEFFLILTNNRKNKDRPTIIPIYNNNVEKITINNSESSFELIKENLEILKLKPNFIFEVIYSLRIANGLTKNIFDLYFLGSNFVEKNPIIDALCSLSNDIRIKVRQIG